MSNITNQELNLLRSRPHSTKLWLSIYQPDTVLACQVNDSNISVGDFEITYDNVTGGSYSNIESGMTLLVGSSAGASDKGKIRVRSATASVITAAENYHIDWEDDLYLTVIDFFEIWPIFPRFTESGGIVTWYKDYDILYSSQNEDYGSLIAMGPHRAAFAGDQLYYSATGTANVNDEGIAHSWEFGGGTPSTSSQETPGSVSYPTPGHYTTKLTVSVTGTSRQDISYRHVSIYDRPENGTDNPILRWELNRFIGNREEGGYSVELSVYEDLSSVVDGALVVLFADDIYGTASQSIGGNSPNTPEIVFVGYILGDTIQYDFQSSRVTFEAVSPTEIMKQKEGPIVSLESVTSTSDWY